MSPIKAAMMLFVVVYHSCVMWKGEGWFSEPAIECPQLGTFSTWLSTFHVPMFIFASGYIHSYLRRETKHYGNIISVLARKTKRLIIPYTLVSLLWAIPMYCLFFGSRNLIEKFLLMKSPSQLWFLPMLFWQFVVIEVIWHFKPSILKRPTLLFSIIAIVISLESSIIFHLTGGVFQIASACQYFVIFYAGWAFRAARTERFWRLSASIIVLIELTLFAAWYLLSIHEGIIFALGEHILSPIVRLAGCAMVLSVAGKFRNVSSGRVRKRLERNSFGIYLFHQQLVWIILYFLNVSTISPLLTASIAFIFSLLVSSTMTDLLQKCQFGKAILGKI